MCYLSCLQERPEAITVLIDLVLYTLQNVSVGNVLLARIKVVQANLLYCLNKLNGTRDQCGRGCLEQSIRQKRKQTSQA